MPASLLREFEDRRRQVRHYVAVVATAERVAGVGRLTVSQERRLLTLRSGVFLVLYNLIESSLRASIEAIHDRVVQDKVPFHELNPPLRKEILRLFKADTKSRLDEDPGDFPSALVAAALGHEFKLSGNVDSKLVRYFGSIYGFSTETVKDRTWDGVDLLSIKTNRNDLAHGRKSYEEVGRNYSLRDIMNISRRSASYIGTIVVNIESYITDENYRER